MTFDPVQGSFLWYSQINMIFVMNSKFSSILANNILKVLSFRLSLWFFSYNLHMFQSEQILLSKPPSMLFAVVRFLLQVIHFPPNFMRKSLKLVWFISLKSFVSSMLVQIKWFSFFDSSRCKNEAINAQVFCSSDIHRSVRHTIKHGTLKLELLAFIFNYLRRYFIMLFFMSSVGKKYFTFLGIPYITE